MTITQLQYFVAVATSGHFSQAAEDLNVNQSTISMSLHQLEEELGIALFERVGRKKRLTTNGIMFMSHAIKILDELDASKADFSETHTNHRVNIKLALDITDIMIPGEIEFLKRNPNINLFQSFMITDKVKKSLLQREVDFGITHVSLESKMLDSTPFFSERMGLMVSKDHPLSSRRKVSLAELSPYSFITMHQGSSYREMTDQFCRYANFKPNIRAEVLHMQMLRSMVAANLGISFISDGFWIRNILPPFPNSFSRNDFRPYSFDMTEQLKLIPISDDICRRVFFISNLKMRNLSQNIWYFYLFICQYYKNVEKEQTDFRQKLGWL